MKALIIGHGSAGRRHHQTLVQHFNFDQIDLVTKQSHELKVAGNIQQVQNLDQYDYYIIASNTIQHFEELNYLNQNLKNKTILCEKPLFEKHYNITKHNQIFIAYQLRFHHLIQTLKQELTQQKVISAHFYCGQYLPSWRDRDYRKCYSSHKDQGGGVLLDLSHELDLSQYLFGRLNSFNAILGKYSSLDISSDDTLQLIGKTEQQVVVNIALDYLSKIKKRSILVHTHENSYELDFIKNHLQINDQLLRAEESDPNLAMHREALQGDPKNLCHLDEALSLMHTIDSIDGDALE